MIDLYRVEDFIHITELKVKWFCKNKNLKEMKSLNRNEIHPIKMSTNPPEIVVNCGMKVINTDGFIYEYVGIGWIKTNKAEQKDYLEIPQLTD